MVHFPFQQTTRGLWRLFLRQLRGVAVKGSNPLRRVLSIFTFGTIFVNVQVMLFRGDLTDGQTLRLIHGGIQKVREISWNFCQEIEAFGSFQEVFALPSLDEVEAVERLSFWNVVYFCWMKLGWSKFQSDIDVHSNWIGETLVCATLLHAWCCSMDGWIGSLAFTRRNSTCDGQIADRDRHSSSSLDYRNVPYEMT